MHTSEIRSLILGAIYTSARYSRDEQLSLEDPDAAKAMKMLLAEAETYQVIERAYDIEHVYSGRAEGDYWRVSVRVPRQD